MFLAPPPFPLFVHPSSATQFQYQDGVGDGAGNCLVDGDASGPGDDSLGQDNDN